MKSSTTDYVQALIDLVNNMGNVPLSSFFSMRQI